MTTTYASRASNGSRRKAASGRVMDVPGLRLEAVAGIVADVPESIEYVDHPLFSKPNAEAKLLGTEVEVPRWFYFHEEIDDPAGLPRGPARLSNDDERTLFLRYNYCRYRLSRLIEAQRRCRSEVSFEEMLVWYRRALDARATTVRANMALVVAMAKRSQTRNVEFSELVSEGNMALLRSVDKFDISRGFKFSTYACRAILKSFNRLVAKADRYRRCFPTEFDPSLERSDYAERKHQMQRDNCTDALRQILLRNRANLSSVELTVVMERFAIGSEGKGRTLSEVAKIVGLTSERVRQIQRAALSKIRQAFEG